ncbi:MAG: cell division transport system permease protein [Zhongshania sp.]|jgi:cell division transport system permease protein|nr:permease-like cell division protein FtsX [Zhongshania sp.]
MPPNKQNKMNKRRLGQLQGPAGRKDVKGARKHKTSLSDRLAGYRSHHQQVAMDSLRRLIARPATSIMTILVIAIALALPTGLYVGLNNIDAVSDGWEGAARISLFLKPTVSADQAEALRRNIAERDGVIASDYISPDSALEEFRASSGFGDVLDQLDSNPLPGLIVVTPREANVSAAAVTALQAELGQLPEVDLAKLDMEWLQRLNRITELGRRLTLALAAMLAVGVLLIIGNTIKLAIEGRRAEILVVKLVGGTNAFVRRPFLYTGLWYGLGGGVTAWLLVQCGLWWLSSPITELSLSYQSDFHLLGLGFVDTIILWLFAAGLGLLGAWLVVGRELRAIEPR